MDKTHLQKVILSSEMARVEKLSIEEGASSEGYMLKAGLGISEKLQDYIENNQLSKRVILLVGKGNNGGDAYVAGCDLLKKGYKVLAFYLFDAKECSRLNALHFENFQKSGGEVKRFTHKDDLTSFKEGLILDGLLGTGFAGDTEGLIKEAIDGANASCLPKIAIDIPSGLNGNTGQASRSCIKAHMTIYLGQPKIGFFLRDGYNVIGDLACVDFGLEKRYLEQMQEEGFLFHESFVSNKLPSVLRTQHKYQKGYVVALAGSKGMTGAAKLSCLAAFRSGAGIVRLFYHETMATEIVDCFPELIKSEWSKDNLQKLFEEEKRAKALLIGPGLGSSEDVEFAIKELLSVSKVKTIIDADAISVFCKHVTKYPKDVVLTPHKAEFLRCFDEEQKLDDKQILEKAEAFVKEKQVTLVLKGAPTYVFHPGQKPVIFPFGDPGMATAGSGDVLSGVIAAFLAQGLSSFDAACLSVYIHAKAGELAAKKKNSYSLMASDIIENISNSINLIKNI